MPDCERRLILRAVSLPIVRAMGDPHTHNATHVPNAGFSVFQRTSAKVRSTQKSAMIRSPHVRDRGRGPVIGTPCPPQARFGPRHRKCLVRLTLLKGKAMSDEEMKAELERLRNENAALKKGASTGLRMKVSEKGAVSIYGMGRFPVTLYKEQWLKLLDMSADIRAFIAANDAQLKKKD